MAEVLIIKFDIDPEVEDYMEVEGVTLTTALHHLERDLDEAVTTELDVVERDELEDYGTKGKDYIVIKNVNQLQRYGYELEDVLDNLNLDSKALRKLGVTLSKDDYDDED